MKKEAVQHERSPRTQGGPAYMKKSALSAAAFLDNDAFYSSAAASASGEQNHKTFEVRTMDSAYIGHPYWISLKWPQ